MDIVGIGLIIEKLGASQIGLEGRHMGPGANFLSHFASRIRDAPITQRELLVGEVKTVAEEVPGEEVFDLVSGVDEVAAGHDDVVFGLGGTGNHILEVNNKYKKDYLII